MCFTSLVGGINKQNKKEGLAIMKSISINLLEAALEEKEEYLEELKKIEESIQEQIANLQYEVDELLIRIYNTYKEQE